MRALVLLLLVGCSYDEPLCRWEPTATWTPTEAGAAWVEGDAGVAYEGHEHCPNTRCLDVAAGQTVVFLEDPWGDGGTFLHEPGRHCL
jgi:hypothetical protein